MGDGRYETSGGAETSGGGSTSAAASRRVTCSTNKGVHRDGSQGDGADEGGRKGASLRHPQGASLRHPHPHLFPHSGASKQHTPSVCVRETPLIYIYTYI
jgi:hypothetical protein